MRFEFKPSFERSIKQLPQKDKEEIREVAVCLVDILSRDKDKPQGIGLKRMRGNFWEARKGIKARILFRWRGDLAEFVLAGNHDDIRRFLKNV